MRVRCHPARMEPLCSHLVLRWPRCAPETTRCGSESTAEPHPFARHLRPLHGPEQQLPFRAAPRRQGAASPAIGAARVCRPHALSFDPGNLIAGQHGSAPVTGDGWKRRTRLGPLRPDRRADRAWPSAREGRLLPGDDHHPQLRPRTGIPLSRISRRIWIVWTKPSAGTTSSINGASPTRVRAR